MDLRVLALSGELLATLQAIPSDTVGDLAKRLQQSCPSSSPCDVKLVLGNVRLDENRCLKDVDVNSTKELYMIRVPVSAREILFKSPADAFEVAKQYDALEDSCGESIGSLFQDAQGNARSLAANAEAISAVHAKLSSAGAHSELAGFRAALTKPALQTYKDILAARGLLGRDVPVPVDRSASVRHMALLVKCSLWLGLPAVLSFLAFDQGARIRQTLVDESAKLPLQALDDLLKQLPPAPKRKGAHAQGLEESLRSILEEGKAEAKQRARNAKSAVPSKRSLKDRKSRAPG